MHTKISARPDAPPGQTPRRLVPVHAVAAEALGRVLDLIHATGPHPPHRRAELSRAHDAARVLLQALCQSATQDGSAEDLATAAAIGNAAHAALCAGRADHAARIALIDRIETAANVVAERGVAVLAQKASEAAEFFALEWPDYGRHLSATDFAAAVEKWLAVKAAPRAGKWPHIAGMLRRAGLHPPTPKTLEAQWSRHLAARRAVVWSWDGARWVGKRSR
jgi:hypothetical protein